MNRTDVNKVEVNRVRVNMCTVNSFAARKAKGGTAMPVPIAKYMCYGKTNDDEDRDILQDLSGNGHDIQLYNFGYALGSGYGLYYTNFENWTYDKTNLVCDITKKQVIITCTENILWNNFRFADEKNLKLRFKTNFDGRIYYRESEGGNMLYYTFNKYSVCEFDFTGEFNKNIYFLPNIKTIGEKYIIEQIPDHQGALVSDGVDDYGLCENFPILTPEKGFTICAIRTILSEGDKSRVLLSNAISTGSSASLGAFYFERLTTSINQCCSFGTSYTVDLNKNLNFSYQTSTFYNGMSTSKGSNLGQSRFNLFCWISVNGFISAALYALEIYDRDLTDEEIAKVKSRMINEYEEKTGNMYDETGALVADYEAYDKTNEDDSRAVLEDLTGNGHDIQLYNFAFTEESGYNKSTYKGALVSDGVDDYGLCENFPIFTKEKGYTILAIREILQQQDESNHVFISNAESAQQSLSGAFVNERINSDNTYTIYSFGSTTSTGITVNRPKSVNWQISSRYNGYPINVGNISATSKLNIFSMTKATFTISSALYALKIYNRDLTDEEIDIEKAKMIKRYEEKTGNKYEEETV